MLFGRSQCALLLIVGCLLCLRGWGSEQKAQPEQEPATPPPPSPPTLTLEQMPSGPVTVTFQNGDLTIEAHNSSLSDILRTVGEKTGARIDIPPDANERVIGRIGPGLAVEVLSSLLNGSEFNYVMVGSDADPNALATVVLFPRSSKSAASGGQQAAQSVVSQVQPAFLQREAPHEQETHTPTLAREGTGDETGQKENVQENHDVGGGPEGNPANEGKSEASANVKTSQQTLQDLYSARYQMMQQQQQEGQQAQRPPR
jgi:hypothetical protein